MEAVDWLEWMKKPSKLQQKEEVREIDLIWEDAITGSIFKIERSIYEDLLESLQKELESKTDADACYDFWQYEYMPFGNYEDMEVAVHLPYPMPLTLAEWHGADQRVRTRLVDHVLLRTGLYYALHRPEDRASWENVRRELLQVECPRAASIDNYLWRGTWDEEGHVDVVKAGAVKIKQYMVETSNIQEIRGASILLDEIDQYRIKNLLQDKMTPEVLVYSGGGNMLLVAPEGEGKALAREIERLYEEVTLSAQANATYQTIALSDLDKKNFADTMSWLDMVKSERQMVKVPNAPVYHPDAIHRYREEDMRIPLNFEPYRHSRQEVDEALLQTADSILCHLCKKRPVEHQIKRYKGKKQSVCSSCLHKIIAGKNVDIQLREIKGVLERIGVRKRVLDFPDTLGDLVEERPNSYIGLVYGDGNNLGKIVQQLDSLPLYRYFSELMNSITKMTVYATLHDVMGDDLTDENHIANFEVIAVGGDDIFLIVPGEFSLETARVLGEKFDTAFRKYGDEDEEGVTLSVGVCIGEHKLPFSRMYDTAQELLNSAKKAKKENRTLKGGTLDFMKLKTSTPYAGELSDYRHRHFLSKVTYMGKEMTLKKLLRPYTWKEMKDMEEWVKEIKQIPTGRPIAYQLRETVEKMKISEAKLFYLYYMQSKDKTDRNKFNELLLKRTAAGSGSLLEERGFLLEELYFYDKAENQYISPWHDIIELWDIKEG